MLGLSCWHRCSSPSKTFPLVTGSLGDESELNSQAFPAAHGIPARVVLYRMPLQSHARSRMDLQLAIRDELVLRIAELYGRRPEEIDPQWGM